MIEPNEPVTNGKKPVTETKARFSAELEKYFAIEQYPSLGKYSVRWRATAAFGAGSGENENHVCSIALQDSLRFEF